MQNDFIAWRALASAQGDAIIPLDQQRSAKNFRHVV